jgi:hypothetical protein
LGLSGFKDESTKIEKRLVSPGQRMPVSEHRFAVLAFGFSLRSAVSE